MKVKIITLYKGSFPFIDELLVQLEKKGIDAYVFDMMEMYTLKIVNGEKHIDSHVNNTLIKKMSTIRIFGTIVKYFFTKIILVKTTSWLNILIFIMCCQFMLHS
jgi:hypothetical protein